MRGEPGSPERLPILNTQSRDHGFALWLLVAQKLALKRDVIGLLDLDGPE